MDLIEPEHFDAIVVTSGLPEVLVASALARAGKSVLILDAADSYGASWASLSGPDYVHSLINRQLEHQHQSMQQQHRQQHLGQLLQQQEQHVPRAPASSTGGAVSVELQPVQQLGGIWGCSLYTHPDVEESLADKGIIIDLAPKVIYQDEPMVQLLVACQAHNYLEFKLVEGSYMYVSGRLRPVPASRADLFADRSLPLPDKRCLGRFLSACVEAQQGTGRLKDDFDGRPLVDLLVAEGLSEQLQAVVLYGIAMADLPQQQQQQQQDSTTQEPAAAAAAQEPAAQEATAHEQHSASCSSSSTGLLTAAQGLAALQLYSSSLGRYGGTGAFMAPCYGCGALAEAFVRLAAVKGAVTALRHGAQQLVLLPPKQEAGQGAGLESVIHSTAAQTAAEDPQAAVSTEASMCDGNTTEAEAASAAEDADDPGGGKAAADAASVRIVLSSGQTLTTNLVVSCHDSCKASSSSSSSSSRSTAAAASGQLHALDGHQVACAVAVLDGSVVDGESSLLLVFPPGSLASQQSVVIRGLQLGPAFGVAPPGKYLLYLTAVLPGVSSTNGSSSSSSSSSSGCLAEQVLGPALTALVSTRGLETFTLGEDAGEEAAQESGLPEATTVIAGGGSDGSASCAAGSSAEQAVQEEEQQQPPPTSLMPQVLALCYYMTKQPQQEFLTQQQQQQQQIMQRSASLQQQRQQQQQQQDAIERSSSSGSSTSHVLWCPAAPHGFMGYTAVVQAAEAAFRQQLPGVPWLTDALPAVPAVQPAAATQRAEPADTADASGGTVAGAAESGGFGDVAAGNGGGVLEDGELDAIDELTAALLELSTAQEQPLH